MKKIIILSCLLLLYSTSNALLSDYGNGLIYDSNQNLTWTQDANMTGYISWDDATSWANNLTYSGYNDWYLPSVSNFQSLWAEVGGSNYGVFSNVQDWQY